jgi:hypothetical protein
VDLVELLALALAKQLEVVYGGHVGHPVEKELGWRMVQLLFATRQLSQPGELQAAGQ